MIDYGLVFVTGLLTSLHCVGMCGAIVLAYSMRSTEALGVRWSHLTLHAAYNGGRILSYALLGAIVGMMGLALSWVQTVGEIIAVVSGAIMIIAGLAMLGILRLPTRLSFGGSYLGIGKLHGSLIRKKSFLSKFSLGFLTPVLPCGLLYAMLAKAAAAGGVLNGAVTMGVFGFGMAPALMLLGAFTSLFSARVRKGAEMLAAIAVLLMGTILVLRGLHIPFLGMIPTGNTGHHSCCDS